MLVTDRSPVLVRFVHMTGDHLNTLPSPACPQRWCVTLIDMMPLGGSWDDDHDDSGERLSKITVIICNCDNAISSRGETWSPLSLTFSCFRGGWYKRSSLTGGLQGRKAMVDDMVGSRSLNRVRWSIPAKNSLYVQLSLSPSSSLSLQYCLLPHSTPLDTE